MKRFLFFLLLIVVYITAITMHVLNTPEYTRHALRWLVKKYSPQYNVQSLNLTTQRFALPPGIRFGGFQIVLSPLDGVNPLYIHFDRLSLVHVSKGEFQFDLRQGEVRQGNWAAKDIKVTALLSLRKGVSGVGAVQVRKVVFGKAELENIIAEFELHEQSVTFTDFAASLYEGKLTGEIKLEFNPRIIYSIAVHIDHFDLQNCEQFNPQIPLMFEGVLEGDVSISGRQDEILEVSSDMRLKTEGRAKASLFEPIIKSFPSGVAQRKDLEEILQQDGKIPIETAQIIINNWRGNNISGVIHLRSRKLNIDLKQPVDITLDENINVVIKRWQKFSWAMHDIYKIIMDSLAAAVRSYFGNQPN